MKLNKKPSRTWASLCILLVCLLSLASVSPQIHAWAFHGGPSTDKGCSGVHSTCSKSPQTSDGRESQPNVPDSEEELCPVALFSEGVTLAECSAILLPGRSSVVVFVEAEPDAVWIGCPGGEAQVRAPPCG